MGDNRRATSQPDQATTILANARLSDGRLVDLKIVGGVIAEVKPVGPVDREEADPIELEGANVDRIDLDRWLVVGAMAEPHAHLDKALTSEVVPNPKGDLSGAIDAWIDATSRGVFSHENTVERAVLAMELLVVHGVTAVRTHVNATADIGAANVKAIKEAAGVMSGVLDIQIVALPSAPLVGPEGVGPRAALAAALEEGVDLIGGCPHLDPDGPGLISLVLDIATEAALPIDLHVDETLDPSMLTLRSLARQVQERGFALGVTASHCVSLGMQTPQTQHDIAAEVAQAGVSIVTLPQTNLFLQGRDHPTATPRGLTAVKALVEAGVVVAAGADNVQDPFNLVGRSDPLETAALMVMAGHRLPDEAYAMVSNRSRSVMGLAPVEIRPGDPADLIAIDAPSIRGAIADASRSRKVFKGGVLTATSNQSATVHR